MRVAIVLSTNTFEYHYESHVGISMEKYIGEYANDWAFEYARVLLDAGHQPTIVLVSASIQQPKRVPSAAAPGVELLFVPASRFARKLPEQFRRSELGRYIFSIAFSTSLRRPLAEFDVVYIQEYADGRCAYLIARLPRRVPVIASHHGALLTKMSAAVLRLATRANKRRVTFTAQLSPECERLRAALPGRSVVEVPNSFDQTVFNLEASAPIRTGLIWVGRFSESQKQFTKLLEALAEVPPGEWAPLTVVGDGSDSNLYHELSSQLGLDQHVDWVGFVRQREVLAQRLGAARLFVSPSRHEAFPLVVLEANACGTPAVLSDIESHRAIKSKGTLLYPLGNKEALIDAIRTGLRDQAQLQEAIIAERVEFEDRYSARALGQQLGALLDELTA